MLRGTEPNEEGFFSKVYKCLVLGQLTEDQLQKFTLLESNEDRILYLYDLLESELVPRKQCQPKSVQEASELKALGNAEFGKGKYEDALSYYSQSALKQAVGTDNEKSGLAVILANRSATLFYLEEFQLCLADIDLALKYGYPSELLYKLHERKARCHVQLSQSKEAVNHFKLALSSLKSSNLNGNKRAEKEKELLKLIDDALLLKEVQQTVVQSTKIPLIEDHNALLPSASKKLRLNSTAEAGRFLEAAAPIQPGEVLVTEKAYVSVLSPDKFTSHCPTCFFTLRAPVPCEQCADVAFCSVACREEAVNSWHRYECPIMNTLSSLGGLDKYALVVRIFTQTKWDTLRRLESKLKSQNGSSPAAGFKKPYDNSSYENVHNLVIHFDKWSCSEVLLLTIAAIYLLKCLRLVGYFKDDSLQNGSVSEKDASLSKDELFAACLLMHHLQVVQYNVHSIPEFHQKRNGFTEEAIPERLGCGLFSTMALFNHTCETKTVRYCIGNQVVLRALHGFKVGEEVPDNYGADYRYMPKEQRELKTTAYRFECKCRACEEDWPLYAEMTPKVMPRFRCGNKKCGAALPLTGPVQLEKPIKCCTCRRNTDIVRAFQKIQDNKSAYEEGVELMKKRKFQEALPLIVKNFNALETVFAPPYMDYRLFQEALRYCCMYAA